MRTTLDGQALFDEHGLELEAGSFRRDSVERTVPGLDGVLSIDMGARSRAIVQRGTLRAAGASELDARIEAISAYMDGRAYSLATADGRTFEQVRLDLFKTGTRRSSGGGVAVDYEIVYTQLQVP